MASDSKESTCNAGDLGLVQDPLENGMATHILAWKFQKTEDPGRLQVHGLSDFHFQLGNGFISCSLESFTF